MRDRIVAAVRGVRLATATAVLGVIAAIVVAVTMPRGLFSGDEGLKLAQTQQLIASHFTDSGLYDPGARYTGDRRLNPYTAMPGFTFNDPHSKTRVYGTYPLLYSTLAVPFYWIGGPFAVAGLSLVGFALSLLVIVRLARRCLDDERAVAAVVAIVAVASPMLFYGSLIFEHTLGVAALVGAIVVALGDQATVRRLIGAGALYGLATCFRTELYAFAPSFAAILIWRLGLRPRAWTRWLGFALGAALVVAAFLIAHRLATPFWHPTLAISKAAAPVTFKQRFIQLVPKELFASGKNVVLWTLVAAVVANAPGRARKWAAMAATLGVTILWAWFAWKAIGKVDGTKIRTLTGLCTATPIVVLALVRGVERRDRESPVAILTLAAVMFVAIIVLLPKRGSGGGLELGSRYMLPVVPLFAIAAIDHARRHRVHLACAAVLAAFALWATGVNLKSERTIRGLGASVVTAIEQSRAEAAFTPVWWVSQLAVPGQDQAVLFVGGGSSPVYDRLYIAGKRRIVSLRGGPPKPSGRVQLRPLPKLKLDDKRVGPQVFELYVP